MLESFFTPASSALPPAAMNKFRHSNPRAVCATPSVIIKTSPHRNLNVGKFSDDFFRSHDLRRTRRVPIYLNASRGHDSSTSPAIQPDFCPPYRKSTFGSTEAIERDLEKAIYGCRFMAFLGVFGSLIGSFICFVKGCTYVITSFREYFVNRGKVIMLLVEAIDVYLLGTVMLVFGMGLYELFVSNLGSSKLQSEEKVVYGSNLFGLFSLKERPSWLDIKTINELKTKLGHVIVMLLLIGFFENSKKAVMRSPEELLCFAASIFISSGSLLLLSKLNDPR